MRLLDYALLVAALLGASPELRAEAAPGSPQPADRCWVGMLGAVTRPGVYEFPGGELELATAVQHAGGLTAGASGAVQVVRRGEPGPPIAYSPQLPLQSGDFVVVMAGGAQQNGVRSGFLPPDYRSAVKRDRPSVSHFLPIGLANVTDRPVIVPVPIERATILDILEYLGQHDELLSSVRLIQPPTATDPFREPIGTGGHLAAGSVLVFDRSALREDRLPSEFPPAIPVRIERIAAPVIPAVAFPAVEPIVAPETAAVPAAPAEPEKATAPPSNPNLASASPARSVSAADEPPVEDRRSIDWTLAGIVVGIFLVLAGSLRLRSVLRSISRPAAPEPDAAASVRQPVAERPRLLKVLIKNQLPLTEEPCELPAVLEFYGRPAGLVHFQPEPTRATPGPALAAPHYFTHVAAPAQQTSASREESAAAEVQRSDESAARRTDASHPFVAPNRPHGVPRAEDRPSILGRVLTRLDGEAHA